MNIHDRLKNHAKKTVANGNYFLVVGYLFVAPALVSIYIYGYKGLVPLSIVGVLFGAYGLLLSIVANDKRSYSSKLLATITIPIMFVLISIVYGSL